MRADAAYGTGVSRWLQHEGMRALTTRNSENGPTCYDSVASQQQPMRDPHVERLHYDIDSEEGTSYRDPEPLAFTNPLGRFEARDGKLIIEPTDHFPDEDAARDVIERFLKAWEIDADLESNIGTIRFKFLRTDVIDRDPPPPGTAQVITLPALAGSVNISGGVASLHVIRRKYPAPPVAFQTTIDVERAYRRWLDFRSGRETLQSTAYFILTMVEAAVGDRKQAAKALNIELDVLRKIGELSSTRGDAATARKAPSSGVYRELTGPESGWLEQATRRVIKRLGEHASGSVLSRIGMADLPNLT
jgi:hypothetical protein